MNTNKDLIAYSMDYASFLLNNLPEKQAQYITDITLFGSVARGDFDDSSDIDIFINVKDKKPEKAINHLTEEFFNSAKYREYWKLKGIDRKIRPVIGKINDWKDLKESIALNGITIYGKHKPLPQTAQSYMLFQWSTIKNQSTRVLLNKQLFGYNQHNKKYKGKIELAGGEKLGTNCAIVPIEHYTMTLNIFRNLKIPAKMRQIFI